MTGTHRFMHNAQLAEGFRLTWGLVRDESVRSIRLASMVELNQLMVDAGVESLTVTVLFLPGHESPEFIDDGTGVMDSVADSRRVLGGVLRVVGDPLNWDRSGRDGYRFIVDSSILESTVTRSGDRYEVVLTPGSVEDVELILSRLSSDLSHVEGLL